MSKEGIPSILLRHFIAFYWSNEILELLLLLAVLLQLVPRNIYNAIPDSCQRNNLIGTKHPCQHSQPKNGLLYIFLSLQVLCSLMVVLRLIVTDGGACVCDRWSGNRLSGNRWRWWHLRSDRWRGGLLGSQRNWRLCDWGWLYPLRKVLLLYCIDAGMLALTTVLSSPLILLGMKRTPKFKISLIYSSRCHIEPSYLSIVPMWNVSSLSCLNRELRCLNM